MSVPRERKRHTKVSPASAYSETTSSHKIVCPAGVRWEILHVAVKNDVNATINSWVDIGGENVALFISEAATTTLIKWPQSDPGTWPLRRLYLDEGDFIQLDFGVAQGAGAYINHVVLEVSL